LVSNHLHRTLQPPASPLRAFLPRALQSRGRRCRGTRLLAILSDYIHLNPVRARLVTLDQRLFDCPWSSYRWFAATPGRRAWCTPEIVLGELGFADDPAGRRGYAERMRQRAVEELTELSDLPARTELRRGWLLGGPAFRERMLALLELAAQSLPRYRQVDAPEWRYRENQSRRCGRAREQLNR
jgi:hypothetical protein